MSSKTLIEHAAYELHKAGTSNHEDPEVRQVAINTMALVRRIDKMNMTEKQLEYTLYAFQNICEHKPLSPITDNPEEWDKFEIKRKDIDSGEEEVKVMWQSRRMPSLFSEDQGKTFRDEATGQTGTSLNHIELAEAEKKEAAAKVEAKAKAEERRVTGGSKAVDEAPAPKNVVADNKETK